jgi:RND family efflux transporter MFP subunit
MDMKKTMQFLSHTKTYLPYLKKIQKKRYLYPSVGAFAVILLATILTPKSSNISTTGVEKGDFSVSITVSGEMRATKSVTLAAPGVWDYGQFQITWLIPEGTTVKEGDIVARLDTTNVLKFLNDKQSQLNISLSDLAKAEADHKASTAQSEADVKNAEFTYELSKLNYERGKFEAEVEQKQNELQLKKDSIALEQAKEKLITQEEINRSETDKINLQIRMARSDVDKAKGDLGKFTLRASMAGLVVYQNNWGTGKKVNISDQVWAGMPIISLPDLSHMQAVGSVNEVDVSRVKKGQRVKIKLDAFPDREFHGTISSVGTIGQQTDRNSNIKTFEVVTDVDENDPILRPGMTTSNEILIDKVPNAVYVPLESVFSKNGKTVVYWMDGSSPKELTVETGVRNSNYVIIAKGLKGGEKVTLRDPTLKEEQVEPDTESKGTKL